MHISYSLTQIRLGLFISVLTSVSACCHRCSLLTDSPPTPPFFTCFIIPCHSISRSHLRELKNDELIHLNLLHPAGYTTQSLFLTARGTARLSEISLLSPGPSGLAIRRARGCPRCSPGTGLPHISSKRKATDKSALNGKALSWLSNRQQHCVLDCG